MISAWFRVDSVRPFSATRMQSGIRIVHWQLNTVGEVCPDRSRSTGILCPDEKSHWRFRCSWCTIIILFLSLYRFPVILCQQSRKPGSHRENSSLIICRFFDILKKYIDIYRYPFSSGSGWRAKVARRSTGDYRGHPSHLPWQGNSKKFFAKFHHFFTDPVTDFWMKKWDIGGYKNLLEIFRANEKFFFIFMQIFCSDFPSNRPVNRSNLFRRGSPSLPDILPAPLAYVCWKKSRNNGRVRVPSHGAEMPL